MALENASETRQSGLIVALARRLDGVNPRFGKTALQKLVYLIQETQDAPTGYRFSFYNHGPFSTELAADLTYLDWIHVVNVSFVSEQRGGFSIKPGPKAEPTLAESKAFLDRYHAQIDRIVGDFGMMTAKELELRATIIFVERDGERLGRRLDESSLVGQVWELKPQFSLAEIDDAIRELSKKGYISSERNARP